MIADTHGQNIEICYRADVTGAWNIDEGRGSPAPNIQLLMSAAERYNREHAGSEGYGALLLAVAIPGSKE
jgi:hypothetical protein